MTQDFLFPLNPVAEKVIPLLRLRKDLAIASHERQFIVTRFQGHSRLPLPVIEVERRRQGAKKIPVESTEMHGEWLIDDMKLIYEACVELFGKEKLSFEYWLNPTYCETGFQLVVTW